VDAAAALQKRLWWFGVLECADSFGEGTGPDSANGQKVEPQHARGLLTVSACRVLSLCIPLFNVQGICRPGSGEAPSA
jgi:hypothetical protein